MMKEMTEESGIIAHDVFVTEVTTSFYSSSVEPHRLAISPKAVVPEERGASIKDIACLAVASASASVCAGSAAYLAGCGSIAAGVSAGLCFFAPSAVVCCSSNLEEKHFSKIKVPF
jgi:hypothetical protein